MKKNNILIMTAGLLLSAVTAGAQEIVVKDKIVEKAGSSLVMGMTLDLSRGENVLTVEVVSGSEKLTYTLTVQNDWPSSGSSGSSSVSHAIDSSEDTEHSTKLDGAQQF